MQIVVRHDIIDGCMFGQDLCKIDLDKENVYNKKMELELGFAAKNNLRHCREGTQLKRKLLPIFLTMGVLNGSCVIAILKKMFGKSPIGSVVVGNASVFNL